MYVLAFERINVPVLVFTSPAAPLTIPVMVVSTRTRDSQREAAVCNVSANRERNSTVVGPALRNSQDHVWNSTRSFQSLH